MYRFILSLIIMLFSVGAFSEAYICTFDYFGKLSKFGKDSVSERVLVNFLANECSKEITSTYDNSIGEFDILITCDETLRIKISSQNRPLLEKTLEKQELSEQFAHSLLSPRLSGLRLSCVERTMGKTMVIR